MIYLNKILNKLVFNKPKTKELQNEIDKNSASNFYYTNLINSIILFSLKREELEKLESPSFDPIFELETEIDYAFNHICFETIFKNNLIDISLKDDLLNFKKETDDIPSELWYLEFFNNNSYWIDIRQKANILLDKLNIINRSYNDEYITIYYADGSIKQGKKI